MNARSGTEPFSPCCKDLAMALSFPAGRHLFVEDGAMHNAERKQRLRLRRRAGGAFRARRGGVSGGKNCVRPLGVDGLVGGEQARTDEGE